MGTRRVVVWGSGNVGRPAIRAVLAHPGLTLAGVVVHDPAKIGVDVGSLIGTDPVGVTATDDSAIALAEDVDAVVYAVNGDFRPVEAQAEVEGVLRSGTNVVTPGFYPLYHPPTADGPAADAIRAACTEGASSLLATGIDPGWACDILPLFLQSVSSDVTEIRSREIFNYALYDQPAAVRDLIGFGTPMDNVAPMLLDFSLQMVWGPVLRVLADGLGVTIADIRTTVEKLPLESTVHVDGMGEFEAGTQGAFRFEVQAFRADDEQPYLVVEHVTRIDDRCAPDWPYPPSGQGCHEVIISGRPHLTVTVHGEDPGEPGAAGGGNATAANRLVNAIDAVCAAPPGLVHPLDVPPTLQA